MTLWRAFVGDYDERDSTDPYSYRSSLDVSGLSWEEARGRLIKRLAEDYPEESHDQLIQVCGHCAAASAEAREGLRDLKPETPGMWDVDRDEYALWAEAGHTCTERAET